MIITHLEMKNGVRPGSYNHIVGLSDDPQDPEIRKKMFSQMGTSDRELDIMTFLFLLKKSDDNCYLELIDKYSKLTWWQIPVPGGTTLKLSKAFWPHFKKE